MSPDWRCPYCLRKPPYVRHDGRLVVCTRCRDDLAARGRGFCRVCGTSYPLTKMQPHTHGHRSVCKTCYRRPVAQYQRHWREQNREHTRAYHRTYGRQRRALADPSAKRRANQAAYFSKKIRGVVKQTLKLKDACPDCGGPKLVTAVRCRACFMVVRRVRHPVCADCGGPVHRNHVRCWNCYNNQRKAKKGSPPQTLEQIAEYEAALTAARTNHAHPGKIAALVAKIAALWDSQRRALAQPAWDEERPTRRKRPS